MQRYLRTAAAAGLAAALCACTSPAPPAQGASANPSGSSVIQGQNVCLKTGLIKKQKVLGDQDIRFEMNNGEVWVNHLDHRCPGLMAQQSFAWDLHGNTVCSNIQTINIPEVGTACRLGAFTRQPPAAT